MNLGTLDQKEQICIACARCVSMNVCVLARGLQVSVFSPPSEEKRGATMDEFVSPTYLMSSYQTFMILGAPTLLVEQTLT